MLTARFVSPPKLPAAAHWASVLLLAALMAGQADAQTPASNQSLTKTFNVAAETAELELTNQAGAIRISAAPNAKSITVNARPLAGRPQIDATQTPMGRVKVEATGSGSVEFDVTVPPATQLDLYCYKCEIKVVGTSGPIRARATAGNIVFTEIHSPRVEAHSHSGNVSFSGDVLPSGSYTFKSYAGRVEAVLPGNADFKLTASAHRAGGNAAGLKLGGFKLSFARQTEQLVEATHGAGRASVYLWTQDGSIHLQRKQ